MKSDLQNAEGVRVPNLGCRECRGERAVVSSPRPSDEFPDALRIGLAIGILRREALVIVIVSINDDRRLVLI